jgi:hypothetical protein
MRHLIIIALSLMLVAGPAGARSDSRNHARVHNANDRVCTPADVARFEAMLGGIRKGQYRTDPRFQVTVHYLGTSIVGGTCNVALRPGD